MIDGRSDIRHARRLGQEGKVTAECAVGLDQDGRDTFIIRFADGSGLIVQAEALEITTIKHIHREGLH